MYLHILRTDSHDKFSAGWKTMFEEVEPGRHVYVQYAQKVNKLNNKLSCPLLTSFDELRNLFLSRDDWQGVIYSGCCFDQSTVQFLSFVLPKTATCCFSWGEWFRYSRTYMPITAKYLSRTGNFCKLSSSPLDKFKFFLKQNQISSALLDRFRNNVKVQNVGRYVDVFVSSCEEEYQKLHQKGYLRCDTLYMYGTVGAPRESLSQISNGNSIQIGNSGWELNNHADILYRLNGLCLPENAQLIVPLSYGNLEYIEYVIRLGKNLFGNRFVAVTDFMPRDEYVKLLLNCAYYITAQIDYMGIGNVALALRRGAKVFLPEKSLIFKTYRRNNIPVFSLEKDLSNEGLRSFNIDERKTCQERMNAFSNREKSLQAARDVLVTLSKLTGAKNVN